MTLSDRSVLRDAARGILRAGLKAADPSTLVCRHIQRRGRRLTLAGRDYRVEAGRVVVVAAGKAASTMAAEAELALGDLISDGLVVDVSSRVPLSRLARRVAGHPLPDRRGQRAAAEILRMAHGLSRQDLLIVLLSGGASALLPAPVRAVSLADKIATTAALLRAGADIRALNAVRKHLSRIKGGFLAQAASPARIVTLALSDVVGDDLTTIASGPTVADPTTYGDACAVLLDMDIWKRLPEPVQRHLRAGQAGRRLETPKPGARELARSHSRVIGSGRLSLSAAARKARHLGWQPAVATSRLEGEAREVGRELASILARQIAAGRSSARPVCLLAAGETTVTVNGAGRGGRNQELVCGAAQVLARVGCPCVVAAVGTDGIDGNSPAAGGIVDDLTVRRARHLGLAPVDVFLAENDSHALLATLGDAIVTGPTGTNVADLVVLLASP